MWWFDIMRRLCKGLCTIQSYCMGHLTKAYGPFAFFSRSCLQHQLYLAVFKIVSGDYGLQSFLLLKSDLQAHSKIVSFVIVIGECWCNGSSTAWLVINLQNSVRLCCGFLWHQKYIILVGREFMGVNGIVQWCVKTIISHAGGIMRCKFHGIVLARYLLLVIICASVIPSTNTFFSCSWWCCSTP